MRGISMSTRMMSGTCFSTSAAASMPSIAVRTLKPASRMHCAALHHDFLAIQHFLHAYCAQRPAVGLHQQRREPVAFLALRRAADQRIESMQFVHLPLILIDMAVAKRAHLVGCHIADVVNAV